MTRKDTFLRTECFFDFEYAGITYHIVRLPTTNTVHDPHLIEYCHKIAGEPDPIHNWSTGVICTNVYQEFWFRNYSHAVNFLLTWS